MYIFWWEEKENRVILSSLEFHVSWVISSREFLNKLQNIFFRKLRKFTYSQFLKTLYRIPEEDMVKWTTLTNRILKEWVLWFEKQLNT